MVEVSHVARIKFGDGKKVQIPDALVLKELGTRHKSVCQSYCKTSAPAQGTQANPVQDPDGMNYLKISSTNHQ